jgi:callose synthase
MPEFRLVTSVFQAIDDALPLNNLGNTIKLSCLSQVHKKATALTSVLLEKSAQVGGNQNGLPFQDSPEARAKVTKALQDLFEVVKTDLLKSDQLDLALRVMREGTESRGRARERSRALFSSFRWPSDALKVKRLHLLLTLTDSAEQVPRNLEARRRLQFFCNSLFMNMPDAPKVKNMLPFWCQSFLLPFILFPTPRPNLDNGLDCMLAV